MAGMEILLESHWEKVEDGALYLLNYLELAHANPYSIYFVQPCHEDSFQNYPDWAFSASYFDGCPSLASLSHRRIHRHLVRHWSA
jgi:hypothetical protein